MRQNENMMRPGLFFQREGPGSVPPAASEHMGTPVVCATCSDLGWDLTGRCKVSDLITRALLTDGSGQLLLDVARRHGLCAEARASRVHLYVARYERASC